MGDVKPSAKAAARGLKVFLSYSRKDLAFTRRLADALAARGYAPDFDQAAYDPDNVSTGIAAGDEWWQRLQEMIAACETMVFVVSPDSAASRVCDEEIAYARGLAKRIIPLWRRRFDLAAAPPRLSALHIGLDFTADDDAAFAAALDQLCKALDVDVAWYRESARLAALAARWDIAGRPDDLLLSAADVRALGKSLEERPRGAPDTSPVVLDFRDKSRERLDGEDRKQRRIIGRAFVKPAEEALARGEPEHALRIAAAGAVLAEDLDFELVPELWGPAARAVLLNRIRLVFRGHSRPVTTASFSPDGRLVVTGSSDSTVRVWDTASGKELACLHAHADLVASASFSFDGQRIVTASEDSTARVWGLVSREGESSGWSEIACLKGHSELLTGASFSPDGRRIVTASSDNTARVWDAAAGHELVCLQAHERALTSASFSPDGLRIVTASFDNSARIWDASTGKELACLNTHGRTLTSASFSPDGRWIVTSSSDNTARIWQPISKAGASDDWREIACLCHAGAVNSASFSSDSQRIVTASDDHTAGVWDARTGREILRLNVREAQVSNARFGPDGQRIVTSSDDMTVRLWDAATGTEIDCLKGHEVGAGCFAFSPDGRGILVGSKDGAARVWEPRPVVWRDAELSEIARFRCHQRPVLSALFSPDGQWIVTSSEDATAKVWRQGKEEPDVWRDAATLKAHEASVNSASLSPDGRLILTASDDSTVRVWECSSPAEPNVQWQEIACLRGEEGSSLRACFSPDGRRIVAAPGQGKARIWERPPAVAHAKQWREVASLGADETGAFCACFSPDGRNILAGSLDSTVRMWRSSASVDSNDEWNEVLRWKSIKIPALAVAFSPDGHRIACASYDKTELLWHADSGTEVICLKSENELVTSISFSPDGSRISSVDGDEVRIWDAAYGQVIAIVKLHEGVPLMASWHPSGRQILTAGQDGTARIWDVSRTETLTRDRAVVLTAALARGIGFRTEAEAADLLMQDAPADLYAAALARLGDRASAVEEVAAALRAPLHDNCYLSPTQFAEKFGARVATPAGRIEPARSATPSTMGAVPGLVPRSDPPAPAPLAPRPKRPPIGPYDQRPEIAKHVAELGADSPLAALLAEPPLDDRLKIYEDANADAEKAQNAYRRWGRFALFLMTAATLISAVMLFPLERLWKDNEQWRGLVSGLQSAANIIALAVVWSLNRRGAVGRWMETRAEAERLRSDFFRAVLNAPAPAGSNAGRLWREKLALVDAAHLDYQSAYYRSAIGRHSKVASARATPRKLAAAAMAISILLGAASLLILSGFPLPGPLSEAFTTLRSLDLGEPIRWQLGLNTAASALLAYASARAIITQDERNAALYRISLHRLGTLRSEARREAVAAAASAGDGAAVLAYAEEAQEILDADHLAWRLSRPPEVVGEAPPAVLKV